MKICNKCGEQKELEQFYKDAGKKDGFRTICKNCSSQQHKNRYQNKRTYILEQKKEYYKNNIEIKKQFYKENKDKENQRSKEYYKKNKEKLNREKKEYREKNKEKYNNYQEKYKKENREKIIQKKREYQRKRYKNDPRYRIECNLRNMIRKGIMSQGGVKSASTQELLGCTFLEARIYIQNQFTEGMTWENHGEWEIDHIRPMASFDLTDPHQQRECFNWSNLQPMWAEENRSKSSWYNGIKYYHTSLSIS